MNLSPEHMAKAYFDRGYSELQKAEAAVLSRIHQRRTISRDINAEFDRKLTLGERVADRVAAFGGSWVFIILFGTCIAGWIVLNSLILARANEAFDPYPYIMLNLLLSMLAAIQAPIIMMSQNRQAAKDRQDAAHDYEINLKAELEILGLHEKLDALRTEQWHALVAIQQEQIEMLTRLLSLAGIDGKERPDESSGPVA